MQPLITDFPGGERWRFRPSFDAFQDARFIHQCVRNEDFMCIILGNAQNSVAKVNKLTMVTKLMELFLL